MATIEITSDNFKDTIENNDIVLIDYWAEWCGPCRAFGPVFEAASEKYEDVTFAKVNTEQEMELSAAMQIRSIPNLMVFRDGVLLYNQPGMLPAEALDELIGKVKALDMDEVHKSIAEEQKKQQQN